MDRYKELENEVSRRLLEYRNEFEVIKKEKKDETNKLNKNI